MNITRITISLPEYLARILQRAIKPGERSEFIRSLVERELVTRSKVDPIEEFLSLRDKLPKVSEKKIMKAIKKGRV